MTFLYIFLLIDCFKWGLIDHKIHLVTFHYIFLLVDCFIWALIDQFHCKIHLVTFQLYLPISWLFQMGGLIDCKIHLVTFLYILLLFTVSNEMYKIHLVTFFYIFLLVDCFKWALIDRIEKSKSSLWALTVSNVRFTWWHFFISSYYDCKIHLVTFLYIFLLVDCFKWALIDRSEKQRVHSVLCQFQMGG